LVSGTNIKTINGASVLGSGNIAVVTSPSGVSGAIQFSNGSAFASDASNFFWDDTNNRLGVGTNAPISPLNIQSDTPNVGILSVTTSGGGLNRLEVWNTNSVSTPVWNIGIPTPDTRIRMYTNITLRTNGIDAAVFSSSEANFGSISGARLGIRGTGSTSATTSLLVQNSAGANLLQVRDDGGVFIDIIVVDKYIRNLNSGIVQIGGGGSASANAYFNDISESFGFGVSSINASAKLQIDSTTKGFLPPRMTTTQKNAIASPATGLVLYDSTTNKLQCYNGSTWNDLF
jgi:hypothetical protein